jgi:hypothetical protein
VLELVAAPTAAAVTAAVHAGTAPAAASSMLAALVQRFGASVAAVAPAAVGQADGQDQLSPGTRAPSPTSPAQAQPWLGARIGMHRSQAALGFVQPGCALSPPPPF